MSAVEAMPAGRELDIAIAEKVMGWTVAGSVYRSEGENRPNISNDTYLGVSTRYHEKYQWSPSTDIAAAFEVVEKWKGDFTLKRQNGYFKAEFYEPSMQYEEWAETAPLAICRAAFKAMEAKG